MVTDMGEYLVGAYLKLDLECDFVDYNVRPPGGGMKGLGELEVVGIRFNSGKVYLCEVATHLGGLEDGKDYTDSAARVRKKFEGQREYAREHLSRFDPELMFWAPRVPKGALTGLLENIDGLTLVVNEEYTKKVDDLRKMARGTPETREIRSSASSRQRNI